MSESAPLSVTELAAVLKGHVAAMGFFEVPGGGVVLVPRHLAGQDRKSVV